MNAYKAAVSTKAKRANLAAQLAALALKHDAVCDIKPGYEPTELCIALSLGPYRVTIALNGRSHVGAFLAHWHTEICSRATYPKSFGLIISGSINEYHYGKATTCEYDFGGLLRSLGDGLSALAQRMATQEAA